MWHKKISFETLCMTDTTEWVAEKYIQHQWLQKKKFKGSDSSRGYMSIGSWYPHVSLSTSWFGGGGPSGGVPLNSNICVMIKQTRHGNNIPNWICSRSLLVENYIDLFKRRTMKSVLFTEKYWFKSLWETESCSVYRGFHLVNYS